MAKDGHETGLPAKPGCRCQVVCPSVLSEGRGSLTPRGYLPRLLGLALSEPEVSGAANGDMLLRFSKGRGRCFWR